MSGGGSSARQAWASRSHWTPSEVSQEECQPATEEAQSETGSGTRWSLRVGSPELRRPPARFPAEMTCKTCGQTGLSCGERHLTIGTTARVPSEPARAWKFIARAT